MTAAEEYAARIDEILAQRARIYGKRPRGDRWERAARFFRVDPRRALDANMQAIASHVEPDDVVIDVGGGAGRVALPLALRCREAVVVDPSGAMEREFGECAAEAGIGNALFLRADWLAAEGVEGDVTVAANVTYFMREIVRFVEKLEAAARRRVLITVWSVPPPAQEAALFRLVHGEEQVTMPGHRELLPVLWEMGILPDVRVLPNEIRRIDGLPATREEAVLYAARRLEVEEWPEARATIAAHVDELFAEAEDGFRPLWRPEARELVITWERRPSPPA